MNSVSLAYAIHTTVQQLSAPHLHNIQFLAINKIPGSVSENKPEDLTRGPGSPAPLPVTSICAEIT